MACSPSVAVLKRTSQLDSRTAMPNNVRWLSSSSTSKTSTSEFASSRAAFMMVEEEPSWAPSDHPVERGMVLQEPGCAHGGVGVRLHHSLEQREEEALLARKVSARGGHRSAEQTFGFSERLGRANPRELAVNFTVLAT